MWIVEVIVIMTGWMLMTMFLNLPKEQKKVSFAIQFFFVTPEYKMLGFQEY